MSDSTLGWAIVGLGRIATTEIAPGIARSGNGRLAAVVSRDQAKAEQFALDHGARRAFDDFHAMLRDPEVDAVYIATPNALHADQVVAAAAAGKHVLCDKPLATSVEDAQRAVAACEAAGVRLGMMFQTRAFEGMADIARMAREGEIGRVVVAQVEMSAGRNLPVGWRTQPELAGLGTINNIGVHAFDLLRYLLGAEVEEVAAMIDVEGGLSVDTTAAVLLRFAQGTLAYVNANQSVPCSRDDVVLHGTDGRILGRNLTRPNREGTVSIVRQGEERSWQVSTGGGYVATLQDFAAAVAEGRDPSPSGLDGLRSVQLTAAIARALQGRQVVALA